MLQNAVTLPPSYSQSAINGSSSPGSEVVAGVTADKPMLNASETFCKPELKSSVSLARSYSPFGRVNCRPERIVPHISLPQDRLEVNRLLKLNSTFAHASTTSEIQIPFLACLRMY